MTGSEHYDPKKDPKTIEGLKELLKDTKMQYKVGEPMNREQYEEYLKARGARVPQTFKVDNILERNDNEVTVNVSEEAKQKLHKKLNDMKEARR